MFYNILLLVSHLGGPYWAKSQDINFENKQTPRSPQEGVPVQTAPDFYKGVNASSVHKSPSISFVWDSSFIKHVFLF